MAGKYRARLWLCAPLVASGLMLGGCMGSPTYGTDKTSTEQLASDLTGILSIAPKKRDPIDYKPRPELVKPAPGARECGSAGAAGKCRRRVQPRMAGITRAAPCAHPRRSDSQSAQSQLRTAGHSGCRHRGRRTARPALARQRRATMAPYQSMPQAGVRQHARGLQSASGRNEAGQRDAAGNI